jgi:hypothetical protein
MLNKRADLIAEKLAKKRKINNEDIKEALNELIDVSQEGKSNQI